MDWSSLSDWGSLASFAGVLAASVGLVLVGYQANRAKRAAEQTQRAIDNILTLGSGNRATTLLQEIKNVLQKGQWEVGYHQCSTLRALVGDLRMIGLSSQHSQLVDQAVVSLTEIENDLDSAIRKKRTPRGADHFNTSLSKIQITVENILSEAASGRGG